MAKYYVKPYHPEEQVFPTFIVLRKRWYWKDKHIRTYSRRSDAEIRCKRLNEGTK